MKIKHPERKRDLSVETPDSKENIDAKENVDQYSMSAGLSELFIPSYCRCTYRSLNFWRVKQVIVSLNEVIFHVLSIFISYESNQLKYEWREYFHRSSLREYQ